MTAVHLTLPVVVFLALWHKSVMTYASLSDGDSDMNQHEGVAMKTANWSVSLGGLTFPAWWPNSINEWSDVLGLIVQGASLLWISIQILRAMKNWNKK